MHPQVVPSFCNSYHGSELLHRTSLIAPPSEPLNNQPCVCLRSASTSATATHMATPTPRHRSRQARATRRSATADPVIRRDDSCIDLSSSASTECVDLTERDAAASSTIVTSTKQKRAPKKVPLRTPDHTSTSISTTLATPTKQEQSSTTVPLRTPERTSTSSAVDLTGDSRDLRVEEVKARGLKRLKHLLTEDPTSRLKHPQAAELEARGITCLEHLFEDPNCVGKSEYSVGNLQTPPRTTKTGVAPFPGANVTAASCGKETKRRQVLAAPQDVTGSPTKKKKGGATPAAIDDIQAVKSNILVRHPKAASYMSQLSTLEEFREFGKLLDNSLRKRRKSKGSKKSRRGKSTGAKPTTPTTFPADGTSSSTTLATTDTRQLPSAHTVPTGDHPASRTLVPSTNDGFQDTVSRRVVETDVRTHGVDLGSQTLASHSSAASGESSLGANDGPTSAPRALLSSTGAGIQDRRRIPHMDTLPPDINNASGSGPALTVLTDLKVGFANVTATAVAMGPQLQSKNGKPYRQAMVGDTVGTTMRMVGFGQLACDKMNNICPGAVVRMEKVKVVRANQQYQSTESTSTKELQVNSYTADNFKATPLMHLQTSPTHITRLNSIRTADKGVMVNIVVVVLAVRFRQRGPLWTCHALCMDCPETAIDVAFSESQQHALGFQRTPDPPLKSPTVLLPFSMIVENVLVAHEGGSTYLRAVPLTSVHRLPDHLPNHSEPERLAATQAFAKLPRDFQVEFTAFREAVSPEMTYAKFTSEESAFFHGPYLVPCTPSAHHSPEATVDNDRQYVNRAFSVVNPEACSGLLVNVASLTWHAHWYPLRTVPKDTLLMVHNAKFEPHAVSVMLCNVSVSKTKKGSLSVGLQVEDDTRTVWVNVYGPVLEESLGVSSERLDEMAASGELTSMLHAKFNNRINLRLRLLPRENANPHICVQEIGHAGNDALEQEAPSAVLVPA